jgi:DNA-binding IclR family transcriptional regulator
VTLVEGWADQNPQSTQYELRSDILGPPRSLSLTVRSSGGRQPCPTSRTFRPQLIGVRVGHRVAHLASAGSDGHDQQVPRGCRGAHAIADGKVLLAYLEPTELQAIYGGRTQLRAFTPRTITTIDDLQRELGEVRANGYAMDRGERTDGWSYVAVPVRGRRGRVVAAVVAGGQDAVASADKLEWLAHEKRIAAEQLSLRLGFAEE